MLGTVSVTILPTPADRTPPHHTYGPGPAPCPGRGPASPHAPQGGTLSTRSRSPGPPLEGSGISVCLPDLLVRAPALRSGGSGTSAYPATAGARKTLTCRARRTPPRHIWKTVHPTATTTPPAGAGMTPARFPQDQGRYPGRLPRPAPCPTVYFLQCSTTAPPRFGGKQRLPHSPAHVHRPSL